MLSIACEGHTTILISSPHVTSLLQERVRKGDAAPVQRLSLIPLLLLCSRDALLLLSGFSEWAGFLFSQNHTQPLRCTDRYAIKYSALRHQLRSRTCISVPTLRHCGLALTVSQLPPGMSGWNGLPWNRLLLQGFVLGRTLLPSTCLYLHVPSLD